MAIQQMRADQLVVDTNLYPRHDLDRTNVRSIIDALHAGAKLPPVIADAESLRIVDGVHRVTAYLQLDADATIKVDLQHFDSEAAMFLEAVRRNARHGARLTSFDRARVLFLGEELEIDPAAVAGALCVDLDKLGELRATKLAVDPDGNPVPIKRSLRHLAGHRLSERQMAANRRSQGMSVSFHASQVIDAITNDICPYDERTIAALRRLLDVLEHNQHLKQMLAS